jgi:hypothetical protein
VDLINRKFGRLVVIGNADRKGYVLCKCTCGNTKEIRATSLTMKKKPTRSCGCIQHEIASKVGKKTIGVNSKEKNVVNMFFNTNFQVIENAYVPKNNKSGHKGVWFDRNRQLYEAYIQVHGTRIHLGRFSKYEDAVCERERAEKKYFGVLIEMKCATTQQRRQK